MNTSALEAALAAPEAVQRVFADTPAGVARGIRDFTRDALATEGSAALREKSLKDTVNRKSEEMRRIEERAARNEQRLRAQYTALDTKMAQYNSLSNYITQQLGSWSKPK